ncbi:MAG: hypothetical protein IT288_11330 [Bdellovibrionales bacterium]|nr:hypothetical protein [Bdellovibrionales bacterium]
MKLRCSPLRLVAAALMLTLPWLSLKSSPAHAFGIAAVVQFDLSEGWIRVEPQLMNIGVGTGMSARNSCVGICIRVGDVFGIQQRESERDSAENTYFFLIGEPDDLHLALLSFACAEGKYLISAHTAVEAIRFVRGELRLQGHLATSRQIVAPVLANKYPWFVEHLRSYADYRQGVTPRLEFPAEQPHDYVNEICTPAFRERMAAYRLPTLAPTAGDGAIFTQEFSRNKIQVRWDASKYLDAIERRAHRVLNRARELDGGSQ